MVNVLITGANGQLGGNIIYYFQKYHPEYRLTAMYNLSTQNVPKNINIKSLELMDLKEESCELIELLREQDVVIHTAGYINICPQTKKEKNRLVQTNQVGTINFFKNCEKANVETVIYISSIEAFLNDGYFKYENLESSKHTTLYGETKAKATLYFKNECKIPKRLILYPSGIISLVKNEPSSLMKFIYSIPKTCIQFCPQSSFYFVDGNTVVKRIAQTFEIDIGHGVTENILLGRESSIKTIIEASKYITTGLVFPIVVPVPDWLLNSFSKIGEFFGSKEINKVTFEIINSKNLLDQYKDISHPDIFDTLKDAFDV